MKLTVFVSRDTPGSPWNGRTHGHYYYLKIEPVPYTRKQMTSPMSAKRPDPSVPRRSRYDIMPSEILDTFKPHLRLLNNPEDAIILIVLPSGSVYDEVICQIAEETMDDYNIPEEEVLIRYAVRGISETADMTLDEFRQQTHV